MTQPSTVATSPSANIPPFNSYIESLRVTGMVVFKPGGTAPLHARHCLRSLCNFWWEESENVGVVDKDAGVEVDEAKDPEDPDIWQLMCGRQQST